MKVQFFSFLEEDEIRDEVVPRSILKFAVPWILSLFGNKLIPRLRCVMKTSPYHVTEGLYYSRHGMSYYYSIIIDMVSSNC